MTTTTTTDIEYKGIKLERIVKKFPEGTQITTYVVNGKTYTNHTNAYKAWEKKVWG